MKNAKRILTFLLAAALMIGCLPTVFAASEVSADESQIEFLTALKIMENDSEDEFGADRLFSRAELAKLVCNVMGIYPEQMVPDTPIYADITSNNEDAAYIKAAVEGGYMTLDKDGKFWPSSAVSLVDVCKAFVVIEGGKILFEEYEPLRAANLVGILKGSKINSAELTKGQVAMLLYNTLHTEFYDQIVFGDSKVYEMKEENLVLEYIYGIIYGEGVVNGEAGTDFVGINDRLTKNRILIDNVLYEGNLKENYLGYSVKYYYTKESVNELARELVYVAKNETRNNVVRIEADMIASATESEVEYYIDDHKTKKIKLPGSLAFIYNGAANPNWTENDLRLDHGYMTFIDNNDDGTCDVLFVDSYTFIVVGYSDASDYKIFDQFNGEILDLSGNDVRYTIYQKDGKEVTFARGLKANRLLAVKQSRNIDGKTVYELTQWDTPISGEVEKIEGKRISVGGNELVLSDTLAENIDDNLLKLGKRIVAYIWNSKVVRIEEPDTTGERPNAMYLVNIQEKGKVFSKKLIFRVAGQSAAFEDFKGADKITIDGTLYRDGDQITKYLRETAKLSYYSAEYPYAQPVQIWTNSRDEVYKIDTVQHNTGEDSAESLVSTDYKYKLMTYSSPNRSFYENKELQATIPASATAYWIPINARYDEDFYGKVAGGGFDDAKNYTVEPFFIQDNFTAEAIFIYYTPITTVAATGSAVIVESLCTVLDGDGMEVTQLNFIHANGSSGSIKLPYDLKINFEFRVGDVVRWRSNYAGEPTVIERLFSPYSIPKEADRYVNHYRPGTTLEGPEQRGTANVYGTVLHRKNGLVTLTTSIASDAGGIETMKNLDNYLTDSTTQYIRIEEVMGEPKVTLKDFNSITDYSTNPKEASEVFIFMLSNSIKFIYENAL